MKNFVVTIARGYGSGGRTVGQMLADKLGIPSYDTEIFKMASEESGISEELFGENDEKLSNPFMQYTKGVYKGKIITPDKEDFVSSDNLFNLQASVIKRLGKEENCVIIGRCADYILKDYPNVLKVYIHAPLSSCVDTLLSLSSLSQKEAEKRILKIDKMRAKYYEHYTGRDWDNAHNYDLCLNTKDFSFEQCVDIIHHIISMRFLHEK